MSASSDDIRLQVLVRAARRNDKDLDELQAALRALGFEVTGTGKASVSVRATPETFAKVFGAGRAAVGGPPTESASELRVPAPLAEYTESITVAPQHIVMSERPQAGKRRGKS
jgi:hypothetical protein